MLAPAASADPGTRLPPPMFPGNDGAGAAVCLKGEAFRHVVASVQVRAPLWSMRPCRLQPLAHVCGWSLKCRVCHVGFDMQVTRAWRALRPRKRQGHENYTWLLMPAF